MPPSWHFPEHRPGQPLHNTLAPELFSGADEDWSPGADLVRECIQNSLDAIASEQVKVVFQVHQAGKLSTSVASHWFGDLWPHLLAPDCKLRDVKGKPSAGGYVVVEDFGTTGLEGDVEQWTLKDDENRFFNFVRAEGLSGNGLTANTGGSWGVGKTVFNRCSRINSFLALTVRRTSKDLAVFGRSVLRHHRLPSTGAEFQGGGLWGAKSNKVEGLVVPCGDNETAARLIEDFKLHRTAKSDSANAGLSVIIPYADEEITADGIVDIAMREYFYPILAGKLQVEVHGAFGDGSNSVTLTRDNLPHHASLSTEKATAAVVDLATRALELDAVDAYKAPIGNTNVAPGWSSRPFPDGDEDFSALCERFDQGEYVAIRVPITIHPKEGDPERDYFTVHLRRDLDGTGYRPLFVRGWTVVANARKRGLRNHSVFALTTIDRDGALGKFLRAAEPPAHTSWQHDTANIRGRFSHGKATIDFVVGAPKYIVDCLANARRETDTLVWADLFPIPGDSDRDAAASRKGRRKKKDQGGTNPRPPPPPPAKPKAYSISQIEGGFAVARDNQDRTALPAEILIMVGYDRSRGNPIKSHSNDDFDIRSLRRQETNLRIIDYPANNPDGEVESNNRIRFVPLNDEFRLEVTGFDSRRDLVVIGRAKSSNANGDDTMDEAQP